MESILKEFYKDGSEKVPRLMAIPFASAAYIETIGVIFSKNFRINGVLLGPIFLPMICIFIGFGLGFLIRLFILEVSL